MSMDESQSINQAKQQTETQKAYEEVCMLLRQNKDHFSRKDFRKETGKKYHKQALRHNIDCDLQKNLLENKPNISDEHRQRMF